MYQMPRILLMTGLLVFPAFAVAQEKSSASPAPGEPRATAEAEDDSSVERFERSVDPISGTEVLDETELGPATEMPTVTDSAADTDKVPAADSDLRAELETLRQEFSARLATLEARLDQQVARIDNLKTSAADESENDEQTITAGKPVGEPTESDAAGGTETADPAMDKEAQIARLEQELERLRLDYNELSTAVADHATAINNHAEGLQGHTDTLKLHQEDLKHVKSETRTLNTQLQAIATDGLGEDAARVLGNMQSAPQPVSYRLRIHNPTGAEQPLSVNGVEWTVRADKWTYVPVPLGPITVHRPGRQPLEIAADRTNWQTDERGYFINYDFDGHRVEKPVVDDK